MIIFVYTGSSPYGVSNSDDLMYLFPIMTGKDFKHRIKQQFERVNCMTSFFYRLRSLPRTVRTSRQS